MNSKPPTKLLFLISLNVLNMSSLIKSQIMKAILASSTSITIAQTMRPWEADKDLMSELKSMHPLTEGSQ
ncbi:hypothetical protein COLO4_12222 [Corchorus olitorius]|uniref:Uncharacterized protein n=1 Tax=Corchorus olitorius TaxID=93759 RepID=A0A1R3K1M6_9ROSI|nr:hypothetical protein COLO4_12222 [Corchorus olitorius]